MVSNYLALMYRGDSSTKREVPPASETDSGIPECPEEIIYVVRQDSFPTSYTIQK